LNYCILIGYIIDYKPHEFIFIYIYILLQYILKNYFFFINLF